MAAANIVVTQKVAAHAGAMKGVPLRYTGPSSYVAVSGAGDTLQAQSVMLKNIFAMQPTADSTGTYWIIPLLTASPTQSVEFMWVVIATGAEVAGGVDLDAYSASLMAWGN